MFSSLKSYASSFISGGGGGGDSAGQRTVSSAAVIGETEKSNDILSICFNPESSTFTISTNAGFIGIRTQGLMKLCCERKTNKQTNKKTSQFIIYFASFAVVVIIC